MSSSTQNEAAVREAVRAMIAHMPMDKIIGQPTNTTVNQLKQQAAKITAAVKTSKWGGRHGHLALVLNESEYRMVTSVDTADVDRLDTPPIIPANLANNTTVVNRARINATHNLENQEFWKQEAVDAIMVERIVSEVVDSTYVEELEDDYIGYSSQTIKTIIDHLKTEWCTVTTLEKKQASEAFNLQWDFTTHITKFARELDKQQKLCREIGVPAADETKIQKYVENMYASEMFDDKEMRIWENKPDAEKTWPTAKTYFVELYKSKRKFNEEREALKGGFESANSIGSKTRNTFPSHLDNNPPLNIMTGRMSPNDQATMIEYTNSLEGALEDSKEHAANMQTTHDKLLQKIDDQQQSMMKQTAEFMQMILATNNTNTGGTTPKDATEKTGTHDTRTTKPRFEIRMCKHCKKRSYHLDDDCYELEKNKGKRPDYWKPKVNQ
jgi:flagellar hook-associated protein FlgK